MSLLKKIRRQDAVYWEAFAQNRSGEYLFQPGIDVKVRWEETFGIVYNALGESVNFTSRIFVDRVMPRGSKLLKDSTTSDLDQLGTPDPLARNIKQFKDIPQKSPIKEHILIAYV
jgi:hypothetical protein